MRARRGGEALTGASAHNQTAAVVPPERLYELQDRGGGPSPTLPVPGRKAKSREGAAAEKRADPFDPGTASPCRRNGRLNKAKGTGMDLNRKYADHQKAMMRASAASDRQSREEHLGDASAIAGQIGDYQRQLGAAASCAWSASRRGFAASDGVAL